MLEETLRQFLNRLNDDAVFRESVTANPEDAFAAFGLNPAEQAALTSGEEDALRRLPGADVSGFLGTASLGCTVSYAVCPRPDTPGSGLGCGTGPGSITGTNNGEGTRTRHENLAR